MEQQETKITPQDIIDKEFRVKFRGFDMAEVDSFLEEVAENLFKLTEENTVLHEKILALQQDLETAHVAPQGQVELQEELGSILEDLKQDVAAITGELASLKQDRPSFETLENNLKTVIATVNEAAGSMAPQAQIELPEELGNILGDLKQDVAAITGELASLKQDRLSLETLENNLKTVIATVNEAAGEIRSQTQPAIPADLSESLDKFKQDSEKIAAELAGLQEDRQGFDVLKNNLAEVINTAREAASSIAPQPQGQVPVDDELRKLLEDFRQETETIKTELAGLKQEFGTLTGFRESISQEIQELLSSHFKELEPKISRLGTGAAAPVKKEEKLLKAEIAEEPEGEETGTRDFQEEEEDFEDDALEFLNEDDILDVDKLRNVFQSVLDDEIGDSSHESREDDNGASDLLFLDDLLEDEPEPKVTFSMDEKGADNN